MGLDVIGAGFGRTGTLSLKRALEQLGFGPYHHMTEIIEDMHRQGPIWKGAHLARSHNSKPISWLVDDLTLNFEIGTFCSQSRLRRRLMLTIYHLIQSRSGRVIWLAEELGIEYRVEHFERGWQAPPPDDYRTLHPLGRSPIVRDGDQLLTESAAIFDYLLERYRGSHLTVRPTDPGYAEYLQWFHLAEGTFSPHHLTLWVLDLAGVRSGDVWDARMEALAKDIAYAEETLSGRPYIAGDRFTAADIMMSMALLAPKQFADSLPPHPCIDAYLARLAERPAYRRARPFS
jgi:glutathione S-transferase